MALKKKNPSLKQHGIELVYGEPIGSDERIADILEEKALKALGARSETRTAKYVDAYSIR